MESQFTTTLDNCVNVFQFNCYSRPAVPNLFSTAPPFGYDCVTNAPPILSGVKIQDFYPYSSGDLFD